MPCLDCGTPGVRHLCRRCRTVREQRRGSTTERGYGATYQQQRDAALDGATHCTRCGEPFTEENPPTGGHVKALRNGGGTVEGIEPQCRRCNFGWRRTGL